MDLEDTARKIETMEIRGAAKIARAAAEALKNIALEYEGKDIGQFRDELKKAKERLISTRPTAVSLRNGLLFVLKGAEEEEDQEKLKKRIVSQADLFIGKSERAMEVIADIGSKRIKDGDIILTHCNSSAAISTIIKAHKDGKNIKVYATESRPKRQGYITVRQLVQEGVDTTLIVDSAVRHVMQDVDLVVVGADTVASSGVVINKIGTSQIALCAHEARVPVMVCAETYKFSSETLSGELVEIEERDVNEVVNVEDFPGVKIYNPVFDKTPPDYIDVIVTEEGVISPYAAYEIIKTLNLES
ncbi:MAG: ribose 1,5-bisphosphate isomerase [Thermoplasmata archaeon]|nr:MAG: ribose 1,5-bisphosphate isomerase [Thermoplasmata archaeon]